MSRDEIYLNVIITGDISNLPAPISKIDGYLYQIAENGGGNIGTIDSELSISSTNPVQNKVITDNILSINKSIEDVKNNVVGKKYVEDGTTKGEIFNNSCSASGVCSHAEGYSTSADGDYSHSEGHTTIALGAYSHTEGKGSHAEELCSHAEGFNTYAIGLHSHVEGKYAETNGENSHAEGLYTIANGDNQHVQGKYNIADDENKYAFIVGNGTDNSNRSNALAVDWQGNIVIKNDKNLTDIINNLANRLSN